jgi:hypothetical protein
MYLKAGFPGHLYLDPNRNPSLLQSEVALAAVQTVAALVECPVA